jgi:hypothetical protein
MSSSFQTVSHTSKIEGLSPNISFEADGYAALNSSVRAHMEASAPAELLNYISSGKPLVCELDASPYICEFWSAQELGTYNREYEVPKYAPDYFGFATSGGGEMFAVSPTGSIVYMPFIGMAPNAARTLAPTWRAFEVQLRSAL